MLWLVVYWLSVLGFGVVDCCVICRLVLVNMICCLGDNGYCLLLL